MYKLLAANFSRLKKDKTFWICNIFMIVLSVFLEITYYRNMILHDFTITLETLFFTYCTFIGILLSAFVSLFIGTEYSDGTIRNKIVVGHSRSAIYLANLLTCCFAGLIMCLCFILPTLAIGIPLFGFFSADLRFILLIFILSIVMTFAFVSLFTLVSMLKQSRAIASVINILGVFLLLFLAAYINARLQEPETYDAYMYATESGVIEEEGEEENPSYLSGRKRSVYQFCFDALPTGQSIQFTQMLPDDPLVSGLSSAAVCVLASGAGMVAFRKKDIK
ncbi:ABC transporter permease [Faecalicatena acetigenes]|uniref:ABC transporter permease n=1 Tax=Faecalicatena acetigenes TaxID=2981790 RepID=A0ABT2TD07_9FIRM|nr:MULTISPECIES: ABC transporter permease subunit [Lachnospiraceae]MCU6748173.1 ABC transporter permease [Faecalicatena acetigenes]SCI29842.1 Uncharacterized protein conserved in bacteria [uncultured Clostridium sp.]